jgi:hypothetical protein
MLLIPCCSDNHFISRKDIGIPPAANLPSISQLKLVGLPIIRPYTHR